MVAFKNSTGIKANSSFCTFRFPIAEAHQLTKPFQYQPITTTSPTQPFAHFVFMPINLRQGFYNKEILCKSMQNCNILKINDEELITVSRMFGYPGIDLQDKCWILLGKYNLKMLILTCGINGSYVFTPGNVSFQPTPKVEVADTVGAGDSFTAAFIASILKGKSVTEAHSIAVKTSAFVCTQKGAMPILPPEYTA